MSIALPGPGTMERVTVCPTKFPTPNVFVPQVPLSAWLPLSTTVELSLTSYVPLPSTLRSTDMFWAYGTEALGWAAPGTRNDDDVRVPVARAYGPAGPPVCRVAVPVQPEREPDSKS